MSLPALEQLSPDEKQEFSDYIDRVKSKQSERKWAKLLKDLKPAEVNNHFPSEPSRFVHNYSNVRLSRYALEALSLGPKFCCPRKKLNRLDLEVQFEHLYDQISDLVPSSEIDVESMKSTLVQSCYQYMKYNYNVSHMVSKEHLLALKGLQMNREILLSRPDKGSGIVLLNRVDYVKKMTDILSDQQRFLKTNEKDRTAAIEKTISKHLRLLKQSGIIDCLTFEKLRPTGTRLPRLYGLPKIHKRDVPLRPILDMSNSPYHALAKWLVSILEPTRRKLAKYSLRDSFEFVQQVKDRNLNGSKMLSLDVTSLFTNVPLEETVDYLCEYIASNNVHIPIPLCQLRSLILLCTRNIQFEFDGIIYRQRDGVAMGSPLGPMLADVFMAKLENNILSDSIQQTTAYLRYVDDIFLIVPDSMDLECILAEFNSAHPNITFTMEMETVDGKFSFLDIAMTRKPDGSIERRVHRKDTWNGQYTHFESFVPLRQKRGLIRCLVTRAQSICSPDTLQEELDVIRRILTQNGYPERFIEQNMKSEDPTERREGPKKKQVYISLPYKGESIARVMNERLRRSVENTYKAAKVCVLFHSKRMISLSVKDKLPSLMSSFCIYSFGCSCRASYIGRTTRRLTDRVREHIPTRGTVASAALSRSSIAHHILTTAHHVPKETSFKVIYHSNPRLPRLARFHQLCVAEAIAIRLFKPNLCQQKKLVRPLKLPWPDANIQDSQDNPNSTQQPQLVMTPILNDRVLMTNQ